MAPNYKQGKIYQIVNSDNDDVYVGSTTLKYLSQRLAKHKSEFNYWKKFPERTRSYMTSFKILGCNGIDIELIESYPCNGKDELHAREGYWIKKTKNCINSRIAGRSQAEYAQDNKEKCDGYKKKYADANQDKIKKHKKEYYEKNKKKFTIQHKCDCGGVYIYNHKTRHEKSSKHQSYINSNEFIPTKPLFK
jgi:hypothetical protein